MDLYDRIDIKLQENKMTRKELANKLNVSYDTINGWYKRRTVRIKLDHVQEIAKILNTNIDYLMFGTIKNSDSRNELLRIFDMLPVKQQNELLNFAYFLEEKVTTNE